MTEGVYPVPTKKLTQLLVELIRLRQPRAAANLNDATWPGWARMAQESLAETVAHTTVGALAVGGGHDAFYAIRPEPRRGPNHFVVYEALREGATRLTLYERRAADDWRDVQTHTREHEDD